MFDAVVLSSCVFMQVYERVQSHILFSTSFYSFPDPRNEANVCLSARMLTVCSNHSSVTRLLGHIAQRATEMLKARAYLHWYERYGTETEEFQRALNTLSDLTENYETQ